MLQESLTNVKPIGNGLVKSVTDQCPISNGLLKSVTDRCRIGNRLESPLLISSYWRRMIVGCVSFDGHPGSPFFSHRRRVLLSRLCVCVLSFRHHSLSLRRSWATTVPATTLALSLPSEGHSLDLCAQMSMPACPVRRRQLRAL
jgi:hypothetical protein